MPVMMPVVGFNERPGGREPAEIVNVNGAVPPLTDSVAVYGDPTLPLLMPFPHAPQSRFTGGAPTTTIVQISVSEFPLESTTLAVKV